MNWRTKIIKDFAPQVSRLTVVVDPDRLLNEERLLQTLEERGFGLLSYDDPVSFRYAYESQYRAVWDKGEYSELVVLLKDEESWEKLPYDLRREGRKLSYSLADFFPEFNYPLIASLERADLDKLYQARQKQPPTSSLGQNATRDFLLRHVFQIVPEQINTATELLRLLLQRHYNGRKLPPDLDKYLVQTLNRRENFKNWPLARILPERQAFLDFLQGQWPGFIERWLAENHLSLDEDGQKRIAESKAIYHATPLDLPFDDQDVRIYIDNYFVERLLKPIEFATLPLPPALVGETSWWIGLGLKENEAARLQNLLATLDKSLPAAGEPEQGGQYAPYREWLNFAYRWAELNLLRQRVTAPELAQVFSSLQARLDQAFLNWVTTRYGGLASLIAAQPVMLHHVPRHMAANLKGVGDKVALVVLDGLGLDQWLIIGKTLREQQPRFHFQQEAVFAWLPSLTSVSRQALFAGKAPNLFAASLQHTDKEGSLWAQYWQDNQSLSPVEIAYRRNLRQLAELEQTLEHPRVRVAGLVINAVDDIMHGTTLGLAGMYHQVRQWAEQGFLTHVLNYLGDNGFKVFLTSDHGNIEASGLGRPGESQLAETRGERVRVYHDQSLRARTKQAFPQAIEWQRNGLPGDYLALFAPGRAAFTAVGQQLVGHGGLSIEEIIVPFIQVFRD